MAETVTVTVLNNRVRNILSSNPSVNDIWVTGEISNFKKSVSGHCYFVLKDSGAQINCAMFANACSRVSFKMGDSMKVSAFGKVDIYAPRGSYQFIVEAMRQMGVGDLYQLLEELKQKLRSEGLFDSDRKRKLPEFPRNIGVVTSSTGAVIHDIITTSSTRFPANILLAPAQVQGSDAAKTIVAGIELLNKQDVDVIIVGRGGGSLEDLWPFNEEIVARAIASSRIPIVSAVGHETDFTIADFVSDVRAPTPTGAAAIILADKKDLYDRIENLFRRAKIALNRKIELCSSRLDSQSNRINRNGTSNFINMRSMDLDNLFSRSTGVVLNAVSGYRMKLELFSRSISTDRLSSILEIDKNNLDSMYSISEKTVCGMLNRCHLMLDGVSNHLDALNPMNILDRGYSMVRDSNGRIISSIDSVMLDSDISISLKDGEIVAVVKDKVKK